MNTLRFRTKWWLRGAFGIPVLKIKGRFIRNYRKARLAYWKALVFFLALPQRFLNACSAKRLETQRKIEGTKVRPHFIVDNPNKLPMPANMRAATTRLALQQLAFTTASLEAPRVTNKEILAAYKSADMVRGTGKVPTPPPPKPPQPSAADLINARTKQLEEELKLAESVAKIEEQSARVSKALVGGIVGGLAQAVRNINAEPVEEDDDDEESLGEETADS